MLGTKIENSNTFENNQYDVLNKNSNNINMLTMKDKYTKSVAKENNVSVRTNNRNINFTHMFIIY